MPLTLTRQQYAEIYGPTVGDQVRLGDTDLFIEVERDLIAEGGGYGGVAPVSCCYVQCAVLYKNGLWGAKFVANVFQDLDVQATKKPHFLIVTGENEFARNAGGGQPGRSVVYVVDSTTGSFAVYAVPWNRQAEATLTPQGGNLVVLQKGRARNLQIRDQ